MKDEIVIKEDGKLFLRRIPDEIELDVNDALVKELSGNLMVKSRNVATIPEWGTVHLAAKAGGEIWWTVKLKSLPLMSYYEVSSGGVVYPFFKQSSAIAPLFPLKWQVPDSMNLFLTARTGKDGEREYMIESYLFAQCSNKRFWRLPLANLFETCKLCLGNESVYAETSLDVLKATLVRFEKAQWNADLSDRLGDKPEKFFRFKAADSGFETLPIDASDWTALCEKVAVLEMEYVVC